MGEGTFVSRRTGPDHSLPRLFRCYGSCAQQLTWRAPAHVLPYGHIAAANVSLCRLRFIICAKSALVIFLVTTMPHGKFGRLGRPATVCRRPGSGDTWTTPMIIDFALDGLPHCHELDLFCMSLSRLLDRIHATRRHQDAAGTCHPLRRTALSPAGAVH